MEQELTIIIQELTEAIIATELKVSDDMIFDKAVSIYLSNKIQENKQKNIQNMKEEPATIPQKKLMSNLGIKFPANVTKHEASLLIKERKEQNANL